MTLKTTLEDNNLNNGQWADFFASDKSDLIKEDTIHCVYIDTDQSYYSSQIQADIASNRKFFDRSAPRKIAGQNSVISLFDVASRKDRATSGGYLSSSVDIFRQGVEITQNKHQVGIVKISAGTPGHFIDLASYGVNESNKLTDNNFFQELNLFNPIEFISVQSTDKLIEQIITFPIVTSDANQRENEILNGIIEPFPIRPIIAHFSIYFPTEPQGIKANLSNGDHFLKKSSDTVNGTYEFLPNWSNKEVFLDASDPVTISNDQGDVTVQVGPSMPVMSNDINYIEPFIDAVYARGDTLEATRSYQSDLLNAIRALKPMNTTYLDANEFSGRTGFTYNDSVQGVDSIAFGGLTR